MTEIEEKTGKRLVLKGIRDPAPDFRGRVTERALYYLAGIDRARFKRTVEPGDQLILDVRLKKVRRGVWLFSGEARVDGQISATADILCTARDS